MGFAPFPFHGKGRIMRAARDTIFVNGAAHSFHGKSYSERDKGLMESDLSEKRFVDFNGIKGCIPKKRLWLSQRMLLEKIN